MKNIYFSSIIVLFSSLICHAQMVEWAIGNIGSGNEEGYGIALDSNGDVYVTGRFQGTVDFDPSAAGTFNMTSQGSTDIFLQKLDAQGNFLWARSTGGSLIDEGLDVQVTSSGNVVVLGQFTFTVDFDPGSGVANLNSSTDGGVFLWSLDANGNFLWAKGFGGSFSGGDLDVDRNTLGIDSNDNIFFTGNFDGTPDFDPSAGTLNITSNGSQDVFIIKVDNAGDLVWARGFGGTDRDEPIGLSIDGSDNVITAGTFEDQVTVDFDPGSGVFNIMGVENDNSFVQKLDNNGSFLWAVNYGNGDQGERVELVTTDRSNSIYLGGRLRFTADFDPGSGVFNLNAPSGFPETYIMKLDSNGMFEWAGVYSVDDDMGALTTDSQNNLYITGFFGGMQDFDTSAGSSTLNAIGITDGYVSKYNENGDFQWVTQLSSSRALTPHDVIMDNLSNVHVTGFFNENAISDGNGGWLLNGIGGIQSDVFVVKFDQPTATSETIDSLNIVLYPNPTTERVYFRGISTTDVFQIQIFNTMGQLIEKNQMTLANGIPLPEKAGLYLIELAQSNNGQKQVFKVYKR